MKVLHLLQSDRFSGAENVVCQIISMFREDNDIEMIYCSQDGQIREALKERNIKFIPMKRLCCSEVKRVLKKIHPDLIHAHDMGASFYASLVCGKTPMISHIHNNNFDSRKLSAKAIAYLIAALKSKHIFWVSESSFNGYYFHKKFSKKSSILYNILDIDALYQKMKQDRNEYKYDVVYLGRLTYSKNPQRLMHVLRLVVNKNPKIKAAIIGTGELEEETRTLCRKHKLENNVAFLGYQSNPLKILHDSKVMVMTSRWEGTPMCALEAMALGVPIVSTPSDGLINLVINGETGYLSDNDDDFASKISIIIEKDELHSTLSQNSKNRSAQIMNKEKYRKAIAKSYLID